MTKTNIRCTGIKELHRVASQILSLYPSEKIFLISGKMGAGKTTFIKEICKQLQVVDVVNSPTFSIVNEYKTSKGYSVYHFDLYRIRESNELLDIGYEEYLFSDSVCLIEWPELAMELLPTSFVLINIEEEERTGDRLFEISFHGN